jgi:hypothetical protein
MRADVALVRTPSDRAVPRDLFTPLGYSVTAPRRRYRLRVSSPSDVKRAAKFGVPVSLLDSAMVRALGYPVEFPSRLLVGRSVAEAVDSPYAKVVFSNDGAVLHPRPEDLVVAMLFVDWLGARTLTRMNRSRLDLAYLGGRILEENASARAYRVRLDEFVPGVAPVGTPLDPASLGELDSTVYERVSGHEG